MLLHASVAFRRGWGPGWQGCLVMQSSLAAVRNCTEQWCVDGHHRMLVPVPARLGVPNQDESMRAMRDLVLKQLAVVVHEQCMAYYAR